MRDAERRVSGHIYDEEPELVRTLSPASPVVIWGALMVAALAGAGATVWRSGPAAAPETRLYATASEDAALKRDVARLAAERDELSARLATLERGLGEMKLAMRDPAPETTGSIARPAAAAPAAPAETRGAFGLSLGADASMEAVRRRWTALAARYPQALARLTPRAQRSNVPGVFDLVAGPYVSRTEAERACGSLAELGLACEATAYSGDPLSRP